MRTGSRLVAAGGAARSGRGFQLSQRGFETLDPDVIEFGERLRPLDPAAVNDLAASISEVGLMQPPLVRKIADGDQVDKHPSYVLVYGRHRLQALRALKKQNGDAFGRARFAVTKCSNDEAQLMAIDENLLHAPLTGRQRRKFVAMRVALVNKVRHSDAPCLGGKQPRDQGIRATARELNLPEATVRRAVRAENLVQEPRDAATVAGFKMAARARIAGQTPAAAQQLAAVHEAAERQTAPKRLERIVKRDGRTVGGQDSIPNPDAGTGPMVQNASEASVPLQPIETVSKAAKRRGTPRRQPVACDQVAQMWREASDATRMEAGLRLIKQASPMMRTCIAQALNPDWVQAGAEQMASRLLPSPDSRQAMLPF